MIRNLIALAICISSIAAAPVKQKKTIELSPSNIVSLRQEVNSSSVDKVISQISALHINRSSESEPIFLFLDSGGGDIVAGEKLIQFIKSIPNVHTITQFAASMAHAIVQGVSGNRYVTEDGYLMAHRARGGVSGQLETGELESRLEFWKKYIRRMEKRNASRIGISLKSYKEKVVNEWWTDANDSIEEGVVDEIVNLKCTKDLMTQTEVIRIRTPFGAFEQIISKCPLM